MEAIMNKEQILTFLNNDFVTNGVIYFNDKDRKSVV